MKLRPYCGIDIVMLLLLLLLFLSYGHGHDVRSGCSMMVYDLRTNRVTMAYRSWLHVNPETLLLASNLGYILAVQEGSIVIYRMSGMSSTVAYNKYMTDDFPADDEKLSDINYYFDDETIKLVDDEVSAFVIFHVSLFSLIGKVYDYFSETNSG